MKHEREKKTTTQIEKKIDATGRVGNEKEGSVFRARCTDKSVASTWSSALYTKQNRFLAKEMARQHDIKLEIFMQWNGFFIVVSYFFSLSLSSSLFEWAKYFGRSHFQCPSIKLFVCMCRCLSKLNSMNSVAKSCFTQPTYISNSTCYSHFVFQFISCRQFRCCCTFSRSLFSPNNTQNRIQTRQIDAVDCVVNSCNEFVWFTHTHTCTRWHAFTHKKWVLIVEIWRCPNMEINHSIYRELRTVDALRQILTSSRSVFPFRGEIQ